MQKNTFCESLAMADLFCRGNLGQMKCDKIGLFLKGPGKKFPAKVAQIFGNVLGYFWKVLVKKIPAKIAQIFGNVLGCFGTHNFLSKIFIAQF